MCINCMLCYAACPIYGLDPKFIGPAAIALAQRYNLDNRDEGASERMAVLSEHEGIWGCTFVGECTKVCPKTCRSGRRDPALQADGGGRVDEGVLHAEGRVMSDPRAYTPYHPRWLRQPVSTYWWLEKWSYFRFILRESTLHVRRVGRAVPAAAGQGCRPGQRAATTRSSNGRATPWVLALNVIAFALCRLPRGDVLRGRAAGDRRAPRAQPCARTSGQGRTLRRLGGGVGVRCLAARRGLRWSSATPNRSCGCSSAPAA